MAGKTETGISARRLAELRALIAAGKEVLFYSWPEWREKRKTVLRLDKRECRMCAARGRYARAVIVHHVKHLRDRPDLALSIWDGEERQLISVCKRCHEQAHPEAFRQTRTGALPMTAERWD